ncbi:MAG: Crp/Fnr family transcriptional regulator [Bacteroidales bacterium]|nr:Crp/Fnr family transcriptional regulator [Bacteroidales bacterium]
MLKNVDCQNCSKDKDSIFNLLNKEERELFEKHKQCTGYKKGEIIYKEGDMPGGLICLCAGKVKIFKEGVGGRDQIIRMERPVHFIGFRALFAGQHYIASAVAIEDCSLCYLEKSVLEKLIKSNGNFALKIINILATELGFSNERTVSLTQKHIRGRLAESLLVMINTFDFEEDGKTIKVYLSREDLANLSNMTTSNAIRTLSTFASEGVISIDGRRISVEKLDELKRISNLG